MIIGIGTDLIEIERIEKACSREGFIKRSFLPGEIEIINKRKASAAGNFAAKEAVSKMLGTGFRIFGLLDIEVLRDTLGKPYVKLYNGAKNRAEELGIKKIHVTITDTKDMAMAFVVGED